MPKLETTPTNLVKFEDIKNKSPKGRNQMQDATIIDFKKSKETKETNRLTRKKRLFDLFLRLLKSEENDSNFMLNYKNNQKHFKEDSEKGLFEECFVTQLDKILESGEIDQNLFKEGKSEKEMLISLKRIILENQSSFLKEAFLEANKEAMRIRLKQYDEAISSSIN